jgi:hypothetical protein
MTFAAAAAALAAGVLLSPGTALASFHLAEISEVLVGHGADPNVQYVEIQIQSFQNLVGSSKLSIFDTSGTFVSSFTLPATNVPNSSANAYWIMGTAEFDELVSPGAPQFVDYVIPGGMPAAGGMVCWGKPTTQTNPNDYVDCLAYGSFTGTATSPPKAPEVPSDCFHSLTRTTRATFDGSFPPADTWADGNNDNDFELLSPTPTNNAGTTASMPLTPDADADLAPDCIDPNDLVVDTDTDGCADGEELRLNPAMGGQRDNTSANDFFDVPTPANGPNAPDGKATLGATAARNRAVALTDTGVVLTYVGRTSSNPAYVADNNSDGIADGPQLDRTPSTSPGKPWRSGPPNNAISLQDVGVNLAQVGHSCVAAP